MADMDLLIGVDDKNNGFSTKGVLDPEGNHGSIVAAGHEVRRKEIKQ